MKIIQGNNQIGGYKTELADTIIIQIKPKTAGDRKGYGFHFPSTATNGYFKWFQQEEKNGLVQVKAVLVTGSQAKKQEIKFYLLGNCSPTSPCMRLDSVTVSTTIWEPWSQAYTAPGTLEDIHFTTNQTALAVSSSSSTGILRTADGGKTWNSTPFLRSDLYQLRFLNATTGLVTVANNYAYFTYDGGATFVAEPWTPPIIGHLSSSDFYLVNRNTIYSVGRSGGIVKTTDGGKTWTRYTGIPFINNLKALTCVDENTCYACGDVAKLIKTSDAGKTWQEQELLLNNHLNSLYFLDKDLGFTGGQLGALVRTADGGQTWKLIKTKMKASIIRIHFFNRQQGVIVSSAGEVARTSDGGLNWQLLCQANYGVNDLKKVVIKDEHTLFAIQRNAIMEYNLAQ
ncbi:MAG: WD40/YVTN/BNR-like repeat-containing protein [Adhaeribacter sp.]